MRGQLQFTTLVQLWKVPGSKWTSGVSRRNQRTFFTLFVCQLQSLGNLAVAMHTGAKR